MQQSGESLRSFWLRLKEAYDNAEIENITPERRFLIVFIAGIYDEELRNRCLLLEEPIQVEDVLNTGQQYEAMQRKFQEKKNTQSRRRSRKK